MATTVGTEGTLTQRLTHLITLDYDAIEAYEAAIERLEDAGCKEKLSEFMADHKRHTENLGAHLKDMGESVPDEAGAKALLTQGKVVLAGLMGDKAILRAMKTNEEDTNTAYGRAVEHDDTPSDVRSTLEQNLEDERRHRAWIEEKIEQL